MSLETSYTSEMGPVNTKVLDREVFDLSVSLIMHSDYIEQRSALIFFMRYPKLRPQEQAIETTG